MIDALVARLSPSSDCDEVRGTEGSSEAVGLVDAGSEEGVEGCSWESDGIAWAVLVGIL